MAIGSVDEDVTTILLLMDIRDIDFIFEADMLL